MRRLEHAERLYDVQHAGARSRAARVERGSGQRVRRRRVETPQMHDAADRLAHRAHERDQRADVLRGVGLNLNADRRQRNAGPSDTR